MSATGLINIVNSKNIIVDTKFIYHTTSFKPNSMISINKKKNTHVSVSKNINSNVSINKTRNSEFSFVRDMNASRGINTSNYNITKLNMSIPILPYPTANCGNC
jgi:hypothetical protein